MDTTFAGRLSGIHIEAGATQVSPFDNLSAAGELRLDERKVAADRLPTNCVL
jgi:hypothetical protein